MPGAAPARMPTTSSPGRPSGSSAPDDQRGSAVVIRCAIARAVPDGRSTLPRRCHSTTEGSNPPAAAYQPAAASVSRTNRAAPSERFGATTAAAPASRSRARTAATSASQPVAARMNDRLPAWSACARLSTTASPREASTTTSTSGAGSRVPPTGRPTDLGTRPPGGRRGHDHRRAEASRSIDEEVHDSAIPSRIEPRFRRSRITTAAAPTGVRGPSSPPVPEAPCLVARAPSEPQGPSLPAGPPRLLLRVEGGEVNVRHCPRSVPDPRS